MRARERRLLSRHVLSVSGTVSDWMGSEFRCATSSSVQPFLRNLGGSVPAIATAMRSAVDSDDMRDFGSAMVGDRSLLAPMLDKERASWIFYDFYPGVASLEFDLPSNRQSRYLLGQYPENKVDRQREHTAFALGLLLMDSVLRCTFRCVPPAGCRFCPKPCLWRQELLGFRLFAHRGSTWRRHWRARVLRRRPGDK